MNNKPTPPEFENLKKAIERLGYGELRIFIQNSKPIRIESGIKSIKLDSQQEFNDGLETIPLI